MKQSSEDIDQVVRQAFQSLPDTPPPGSAFDAQRVWGQLNRELHPAKPARRLAGWWWLAGMLFLLSGLGWYVRSVSSGSPSGHETVALVERATPKQLNTSTSRSGNKKAKEQEGEGNTATPETALLKKASTANRQPVVTRNQSAQENIRIPEPPVTEIPAAMADQEMVVTTEVSPPEPASVSEPKVLAKTKPTASKLRFPVVHVNEWQAEEDVKTSLHRSERLVRLGTGSHSFDTPEPPQLQITIPQRIK
ncbi:hypothetical protein GCM10023189_17170 [Nibrella saemangeumensis]|uniref:Uncharacterized protein n=1 Tax=Nibrella saemangeumensis TaxID=1084526 RepID=A0ABP8MPI6_9BACT